MGVKLDIHCRQLMLVMTGQLIDGNDESRLVLPPSSRITISNSTMSSNKRRNVGVGDDAEQMQMD